MVSSAFGTVAAVAVYLIAMVGVGVWVHTRRRVRSPADFLLGDRRLTSWVAGLSTNASDFSGWLMLGLPGAVYAAGLGQVWIPVGLVIGFYLSWRIVAPRLRVYTARVIDIRTLKESNSLTLSSYLENRFDDHRRLLRMVSALAILVFYLFYIASCILTVRVLFAEVFGMPAISAVAIGASVVVLYTYLGGYLAVSYADVIQAVLMWASIVIVPAVVLVQIGGFGTLTTTAAARNDNLLSLLGGAALEGDSWQDTGGIGVVVIVSGLAWGLGYFGQPHILARFMGIRSTADIPLARRVSVAWAVSALALAILVGFCGIAFFDQPLENPESVFITLIQTLLDPWVAGFVLVGVLAAAMSSAAPQLLVAAAALSEDGYRAFVNREADPRLLVWVGRVAVVAVASIASVLAVSGENTVLELAGYAWAGLGAAFGPVIVLSLYWRRMNRAGALAGMLAGGVTALVYPSIDPIGVYELLPAAAVSILAIMLFNRYGAKASERIMGDFDRMRSEATAGTHAEPIAVQPMKRG